ncbi:sensor histidine kinase [Agromyces mediolanus]|uniref:sensor histidine kinase n=1 Tax=Agromyces mediolanus TaxID=41986 RepID=UPI002041EB28|nr:sensor histidine kinase [Agromyces mediolanus]MCM3657887.1 sensor histidine kinase [Agromyces mediolanus]
MLNRRWWDLAAVAVSAVVVTFGLVFPPYGPQDWGSWSVVAVFLLVYVGYLRWRIGSEDPRHHVAITAILVTVVFAGTAFDSGAATLQAFAYPFLWITAPSTKRAIVGNVLLAVAVAAGYAVGLGPTGVLAGIGVGALSLAFSLALGLWITRIAEVGEERARLLDELQAAQGQLAAMHRETGVTEERARLAREIHDTIAQSLTGLVMLAQRAERRLDAPSPDVAAARSDLGLIEEMAREALTEARGLVAAVSPIALDTTLADALGRLAAAFERETGVAVALEARAPGLGRELEVVLLRASQEGLANVRKHARARHASLTVETADGMVRLIVRDDGVGPGPDDAPGFGLAGLRERVALAGGRVSFGPATGGGAELRVELPVEASVAAPSDGGAA